MQKFPKFVELAAKAGVPLMAWGRQGIGKTSVVNQIAEKLFGGNPKRDYLANPAAITLVLSQMEATDLIGLPSKVQLEDGTWRTHYAKPDWWPTVENGILFLDELNRAPRECINAAHQLVLEGRIFNNKLPKGWVVVAACNPDSDDEYGMVRFGAAFMDRFAHVEVNGSYTAWKSWAEKHGVAEEILSFIGAHTKALNGDNEDKWSFSETVLSRVTPTPRSWEFVNRILVACGDNDADLKGYGFPLIKGLVGNATATVFLKHLEEYSKKVMSLADVLKNGVKDPRWIDARAKKDVPYLKEVLETAGKEVEKAFDAAFKKGGEAGVEKLMSGGKYDKFWELSCDVPDDVMFGWWHTHTPGSVWDEIALVLPEAFGKKVADLYNVHNERGRK